MTIAICPHCRCTLETCRCTPDVVIDAPQLGKVGVGCVRCRNARGHNLGAIGAKYCDCPAGAALRSRLEADTRTNEHEPRVRAWDLRREIKATTPLTDPVTERRLLASLIAESHVLAMVDDLEEQDFSDPRCRHVVRALCQLRADGADVGIDEIDHELQLQDMARAKGGGVVVDSDGLWTFGAGTIADKAGFWFVAQLLIGFPAALYRDGFTPYRDARALVEHDMAWLRELADRRRSLPTAESPQGGMHVRDTQRWVSVNAESTRRRARGSARTRSPDAELFRSTPR